MAADDDSIDGAPASEVVGLLSISPEEFVARRNARAKELRAEGRREEATALAKVRKPVRLVWVVGEVARRDPELAAEATAVAEEAEDAMAGHGDVRVVLAKFRSVVARVAEAGGAVDRAVDRSAVELALREVLADPAARNAWAGGYLLRLPSEAPMPADELAPRRAKRRAAALADATAATDDGAAARDAARAEADAKAAAEALEAERRAREVAEQEARAQLDAARAAVTVARAEHDDAVSTVQETERRLAAVQAEAVQAQEASDDTAAKLAAAEESVASAEGVLEACRTE